MSGAAHDPWGLRLPPERSPVDGDGAGGEPGPAELVYRCGSYRSFLDQMLRRVRSQPIAGGEHAGQRPLERFNVEARSSWLAGLLKAWAEVGEVFSFYQERIANEGFLRTATEELSLREIVRLIDYVRFPGAGSSTDLAFFVLDVLEMPRRVRLPAGTAVASVPPEAELPQDWETVEQIEARAEWNKLVPEVPHVVLPRALAGADSAADLTADPAVEPGRTLLVLAGAGAEQRYLRRALAVEPAGEPAPWRPAARLAWDGALMPDSPGERLEPVRLLALEREATLFGHDAPAWDDLPEAGKAAIGGTLGGVLISRETAVDGEPDWVSANLGIGDEEVTALAAAAGGELFAGTPDGIFRRTPDGSWARSGRTLAGQRIECVVPAGRELVAGSTQSGVLRTADGEDWQSLLGESAREPLLAFGFGSRPRSGRLPGSAVRALLPTPDRLFAATDHGVFAFDARRDRWLGRNRGMPGFARKTGRAAVVVRALARGTRPGELFAGTDQGVFRSRNRGRRWQPRGAGLPEEVKVFDLLHVCDGRTRTDYLFAATDQGVFRTVDGGDRWQPAALGLPRTDYDSGVADCAVRALAAVHDARSLATVVVAGTSAGIYRSTDFGNLWHAPDHEVASRPVAALAVSDGGRLAAAVPRGGFALDDWPGFRPRPDALDLSELVTGIEPGDWLALVEEAESGERRERIFRAGQVTQTLRDEFGLSAAVTRIVPDAPVDGLDSFDLRRARLLFGARELELFAGRVELLEPLAKRVVRLRQPPRSGFDGARKLIVEGRRLRLRAAGDLRDHLGNRIAEPPERALLLVEPPAAADSLYRLRLASGEDAVLRCPPAGVDWRPAEDGDPLVAETVTGEWAAAESGEVDLRLHRPLRNPFDPRTVTIYGNVAEATQGRTVEDDVLGDGDSGTAFQRFALNVQPLTHLRTSSPKGYANSLEMRVNGLRWRQVESLASAGTDERSYMVRPDIEGNAAVLFGDGDHGARLPTGSENVVATYRTGMWEQPVEPHSLTILRSKPLGLDGVTNPLAADGGARPEAASETRRRAPLSVRTLGRIVSLEDYRDFCLGYPGVAKVEVQPISTPGGRLLQITVGTDDGAPVQPGGDLHRRLLAAIDAARPDPVATAVDGCRRVRFELAAELRVDPDLRGSEVLRQARQALLGRYCYRRSRFAERITAAAAARLLESVPGVLAVRLTGFHRQSRPPSLEPFLLARPARWDAAAGRTVGAELLELRQPGGVMLGLGDPA